MARAPHSPPRVSRRLVLQGGAVAAGFVWTAPVARTIRLGQIAGSPAPTSDPPVVTVTEPTYDTTPTPDTSDTPEPTTTTTTTKPDENPYSPCAMHTRSCCHATGGAYDIAFQFRQLRPGRVLRFVLEYLEGSPVTAATLYGTVDGAGRCEVTPGQTFSKPWSANIALYDGTSGAILLKGAFSVRDHCTSGRFRWH